MLSEIKADLGVDLLVVNIDEYQDDFAMTQAFVTALSNENRSASSRVVCAPIISGVPKVLLSQNLPFTNCWQPYEHHLLLIYELKSALYERLKLDIYKPISALNDLLDGCGGYPFLASKLGEILEEDLTIKDELKHGLLGFNDAAKIWDKLIGISEMVISKEAVVRYSWY